MTKQTTTTAPAFTSHYEFYKAAYLQNWLTAECGPAPSKALFDVAHAIDPRKRTGVEALHIAMALRPNGCTVRQFQVAGSCGPANNYRRALVTVDKVIKVSTLPGGNGSRAYAFKAVLTAKGMTMVTAALGAVPKALQPAPAADADKPVKAPKAPRKRASKAPKPAEAPATPAPTTDAPQG